MNYILSILTVLTTVNVLAQPSGTLDLNFGTGGKAVLSLSTGQDKAYGVHIQSDGKIIVAGYATSGITGKDFAVVRYHVNGTIDSSFGNYGIVTTDLQTGSDDVAYGIALQTDGKLVLAGYSDNGSNKDAALVRYQVDGTLDSTFGINGIVLTDFDNAQQDEIKVVKIHPLTGNIVVGGASIISTSVSKPVVARYLSNGTLDSTFDSTGIRLLWVTNLDYQYLFSVEDLSVQANGKISAVGWRDFPGLQWDSDYWACRINSDGTMDPTFSGDGVSVYNGSFNGHDRAYAMLLLPDNSIFMSGGGYVSTLAYDFTLFELNANGSAGSWAAMADWGSSLHDIAYGLAVDNNGKYVMAGTSGNTTNKKFALARVNTDATMDNTFGTNGKITTTFGSNALNECFDVAIQADNKIVAVGNTGNDFAIARYLGDAIPELDKFQLLTPADLSVNQNFSSIAFDWSDAFGATSYELDIDVSPTFSSPQTFTSITSTYTAINLLPDTKYYWRVRASDGTNWGIYSTVWSFSTYGLENFYLMSPANGSTNQAYSFLVLDWSYNIGATKYEVQIDTSPGFTTSPKTYTPTNSTYTATLLPSKTYYWRVRATNGTTWGQWTAAWSFTTKASPSSSVYETFFADLKIYPNPANDFLMLEVNSFLIDRPYKLLDNMGRELHSGFINSGQVTLDLNGLSSGIYFLQIGDYPQKTLKFLKE